MVGNLPVSSVKQCRLHSLKHLEMSLFRVQPVRGEDPRPEGADDEQQHQFGIRISADESEEVAVRQVRE